MRLSRACPAALAVVVALGVSRSGFSQEPNGNYVGATACSDCHKSEFDVWKDTKHATSFRTVHRDAAAPAILKAAGGPANMRANPVCQQCHFTATPAGADAKPEVTASVTCEKCHGAASGWIKVHNDFGGKGAGKAAESKEHAAKRIAAAEKAGWLRPGHSFDLAARCNACHGLAHQGIDGAIIAKMIAAGHPFHPEFDFVRYSQGSIRHRFYPPDQTLNAEATLAELSRLLVIGQAAKLVSAAAAAKSSDPAYAAAQEGRLKAAKDALAAVKSVPEAAALLSSPTEDNARKLADAVSGKDLSGEVKDLLPKREDLK